MSILTPCRAACKNLGGICAGCQRTIGEISGWIRLPDTERQAIMAQLSRQMTTHQCPKCGQGAHCDISAGKSTCWCFSLEARHCYHPENEKVTQTSSCLCRSCLTHQPIA